MVSESDKKICLKSYVDIFHPKDDKVLIDVSGNQYAIEGDVVRFLLNDLFIFLQAEKTFDEILQRFADTVSAEDLKGILHDLRNIGLLNEYSSEQYNESKDVTDSEKLQYMRFFENTSVYSEKDPICSFRDLKKATVLFVCSDDIKDFIMKQLISLMPYKVVFMDRSESTLSRIDNMFGSGDIDLLVNISEIGQRSFNMSINDSLLKSSIKGLFADLNWFGGTIGPCVIPGESACYECTTLRKNSNTQDLQIFDYIAANGEANVTVKSKHTVSVYLNAFLSLISIEVEKILTNYSCANTYKGVYFVNFCDLNITYHSVLKSPFCSKCGYIVRNPKILTVDLGGTEW